MNLALGFRMNPFLVLTDPSELPWVHLWWSEGPEYLAKGLADGQDLGNWPDEITIDNATGAAPNGLHDAVVSYLNNQPATFWDSTANRGMEDSSIVFVDQPYTMVVICAFSAFQDSGLITQPTMVDHATGGSNRVKWLSGKQAVEWFAGSNLVSNILDLKETAIMYTIYVNGSSSVIESCGEIVATGAGGSADLSSIAIGNAGSDSVNTRHRGHIALIGVASGDLRTNPLWPGFEAYAESHYGVNFLRHANKMVNHDFEGYDARWITKVGDYAFVSDDTNDRINVYDLDDLPNLNLVETYSTIVSPRRLTSNGSNVLYVPSDDLGIAFGPNDALRTLNISDPLNVSLLDTFGAHAQIDAPLGSMYRSGDRVHVHRDNASSHVYTFDVSDPSNIIYLGRVIIPNTMRHFIALDDSTLLTSQLTGELVVLDDSNRATGPPTVLHTSADFGTFSGGGLIAIDDIAYVSTTNNGTIGVDISNLSSITSSSDVGMSDQALFSNCSFLLNGTTLYTTKGSGTWGVVTQLDVSDPSQAVLQKGIYNTVAGGDRGMIFHNGYLVVTGVGGGVAVVEPN